MGTYLVVMDRAIPPQSLRFGLLNFASKWRPASFVVLQTLDPARGNEQDRVKIASPAYLASARNLLTAMGLSVIDATVSREPPSQAIAEAMAGRRRYNGIVLTWRQPALLRLLQLDAGHRLQRKFGVPVMCIEPDTSMPIHRGTAAKVGG